MLVCQSLPHPRNFQKPENDRADSVKQKWHGASQPVNRIKSGLRIPRQQNEKQTKIQMTKGSKMPLLQSNFDPSFVNMNPFDF